MLDGLLVVEVGDERGWLPGRILSDLGARVVLAEPDGGLPQRRTLPAAFRAHCAGKYSVVGVDLLAIADVVIETGVTDRHQTQRASQTVWCSISPWGRETPDDLSTDLSVQARSGVMWMTGEPDRAPLACSFPTSLYHGGADAATAIIAALLQRQQTGRGQLVDVSLQESHVMAAMSRPAQFGLTGDRGHRAGASMRVGATVQREIWTCADGYVTFGLRGGPARIPGLKRLVAWMADEGYAVPDRDWDTYNHNDLTQAEVDALSEPIAAFFDTKTMTELYDAAFARGLMLAPANDARQILSSRQYRARDLFVNLDGEQIVRAFAPGLPGPRWPAPRVGQHDQEAAGWLRSTAS